MRRNTIEFNQRPDLGLVLRMDEEAREALFNVLHRYQVYETACGMLCQGLAISRPAGIPHHITRKFGQDAQQVAHAVRDCISDPLSGGMYASFASEDDLALLKAPDWYVVELLNASFDAAKDVHGYEYAGRDVTPLLDQLRGELNRVLTSAGEHYAIDGNYRTESTEEDLLQQEVLEPALTALGLPELRKVDADLQSGLRGLAQGDRQGYETAILQAAAAVEGALAVLVQAHSVEAKKASAAQYFEALRDEGVVANHFRSLVMASAEIRNKEAGHSSHTTPRNADADSARAALYSACVAIAYLASKLPHSPSPAAAAHGRRFRPW
jgi:hypothetical protein